MAEIYLSRDETFEYANGDRVVFHLTIDKKALSRLVWKAANNKTRVSKDGAITVEAKKL